MDDVRKPAVASLFYPDDRINLLRLVNTYVSDVPAAIPEYFKKNGIDNLFGIIVPHAGYVYSGAAAGYAYSLIRQKAIDTVILIGPSHFTYFEGFALSYYNSFETPMGEIPVDVELVKRIAEEGAGVFDYINTAHMKEHSLEVQLPFLQTVLEDGFKIVPILMGEQNFKNMQEGAEVLYKILKDYDRHYLLVISSDLSHYHNDKDARKLDERFISMMQQMNTSKLIEEANLGSVEACGAGPICVFLELARMLNRNNIKTLVYKNSGDTSGDYSKVVGYLAAAVW